MAQVLAAVFVIADESVLQGGELVKPDGRHVSLAQVPEGIDRLGQDRNAAHDAASACMVAICSAYQQPSILTGKASSGVDGYSCHIFGRVAGEVGFTGHNIPGPLAQAEFAPDLAFQLVEIPLVMPVRMTS